MARHGLTAVSVVLALSGASGAAPDELSPKGPPSTPQPYGTGSLSAYVIPSVNFSPSTNAVAYQYSGLNRYATTFGTFLAAPVLPNGVQVERFELSACDIDVSSLVIAFLGACALPAGGCTVMAAVNSGGTPGCSTFSETLATPLIVDNETTALLVQVQAGPTTANMFSAVKLFYRLRVSPAPGTSTFPDDVPTDHPFFRFVEALAAAGITGGCGTGSYCPESPVTRGEMAVFLATALGLHFPN
jgi:hypothetical protein